MNIWPAAFSAFSASSGASESLRSDAESSGSLFDSQLTGLRKQIADDIKRTFSTFA